jgi:putative oxygen-independent coproporphyrinogen III oxidase
MIQFSALPELSLYIHLPWCVRKCPYCDFNSHELQADIPEQAYVDALIKDLEFSLPLIWGRPVISIFIGGGTPSLFSAQAIDRLLAAVRARVGLVPGAEITLEANPGTFEAERFRGYADAGVNRLSLGVQSFDHEKLARLGRIHDGDQAMQAAAMAMQIFPQVNLDLMFGLPGQTLRELERDLETALSFQTPHLSLYQLTIEPNTAFAVKPPQPPPADDDTLFEMQEFLIAQTASRGYQRYEISAYAKDGQVCRHNMNYWTFGDYLGIGAGAHGKISFEHRILRQARVRHPRDYLAHAGTAAGVQVEREIGVDELPFEFMLNALRLTGGVPTSRWSQTSGLAIGQHPFLLERLGLAQQRGLLVASPSVWRASEKGLDFLNDLQQIFL